MVLGLEEVDAYVCSPTVIDTFGHPGPQLRAYQSLRRWQRKQARLDAINGEYDTWRSNLDVFCFFFRDSFEKLALAFANQTLPARQSSNVIVPAIELQR